MKTRQFAVAAIGAAVCALSACASDSAPTTAATSVVPTDDAAGEFVPPATKSRGLYAPTETAVGQSGLQAMILSVEDASSQSGPVTVFTFQIVNITDQVWQGYNWTTPTVVYGEDGTPAEHAVSLPEGYGAGVLGGIPPGARQTVKHAYKAKKAELKNAVVTAGSVLWEGDFSTFRR